MPEIIDVDIPNPFLDKREVFNVPASAPAREVIDVNIPNPAIKRELPTPPDPSAMGPFGITPPAISPEFKSGQAIGKVGLDITKNLGEVSREEAFPLTSMAFGLDTGKVPPATLLAPPLAGAAPIIDTVVIAERLVTDAVAGLFGEDPELTAGERGKRALKEDRFLGNRLIKEFTNRMQPDIDAAVKAGISHDEIRDSLVLPQVATGIAGDVASAEAIFRSIGVPFKAAHAFMKSRRFKKGQQAAQELLKLSEVKEGARQTKSALSKAQKGKLLEQRRIQDQGKLDEALRPFKGQEVGRGTRKDRPFSPFGKEEGQAADAARQADLQRRALEQRQKPLKKSAIPKAEKKRIIAEAEAAEKARLQESLESSAEQEAGRGTRKDRPFTPGDKGKGQVTYERQQREIAERNRLERQKKLKKSKISKVEKQNIIERAAQAEQDRLQESLGGGKGADVGRGRVKEVPFTPFNKESGKVAQERLSRAAIEKKQASKGLEKKLEPFKGQAEHRPGLPTDKPFTPFEVGEGKAAEAALKQGKGKLTPSELRASKGEQVEFPFIKEKAARAAKAAKKKIAKKVVKKTKGLVKVKIKPEKVEEVVFKKGSKAAAKDKLLKVTFKPKDKGSGLEVIIEGRKTEFNSFEKAQKFIKEQSAKAIAEGRDGAVVVTTFPGGLSKADIKAFKPTKALIKKFSAATSKPDKVKFKQHPKISEALDDVVNMLGDAEPSIKVRKPEGGFTNIPGGFPEELSGYSYKRIAAIAKNLKSGKKLKPLQLDIMEDIANVHSKMIGTRSPLSKLFKNLKKQAKATRRTLKDQVKDIGDVLTPGKELQFGGLKPSEKSKKALARLLQDFKRSSFKNFKQYVVKNKARFNLTDKDVDKIVRSERDFYTVRTENLREVARKSKDMDTFIQESIDTDFFPKGKKTIRGDKAAILEEAHPSLTDTSVQLAKDTKSLNVAKVNKRAAKRRGDIKAQKKAATDIEHFEKKVALNPLSKQSKEIVASKQQADKLTKELEDLVPDLHKEGAGRSADKQRNFESDAINERIRELIKSKTTDITADPPIDQKISDIRRLREQRFKELRKLESLEDRRPRSFVDDARAKDRQKVEDLHSEIGNIQADLADHVTDLAKAEIEGNVDIARAFKTVIRQLEDKLAKKEINLSELIARRKAHPTMPSLRTSIVNEAKMDKVSVDAVIKNKRGLYNELYREGEITAQDANRRLAALDDISVDIGQLKGIFKSAKLQKRTLQSKKNDILTVLKGIKPIRGRIGMGLGSIGMDDAGKDAMKRLLKSAEKVNKGVGRYLKEDLGLGDKQVKSILKSIKLQEQIIPKAPSPTKTVPGSVTPDGKPKTVKKSKVLLDFEKEAMKTPEIDLAVYKLNPATGKMGWVGGTQINNIPVGKLLAKGEISKELAELIVRGSKMDRTILDKFPTISDALRKGTPITKKMMRVFRDFINLAPEERFAMADVPVNIGLNILDNPKLDPITKADLAIEAAHDWITLRNAFGGMLRASGKPRRTKAYLTKLRQLLDDAQLSPAQRKEIGAIITRLETHSERANLWDLIHEVGVNNMLFSAVTIKRNLVGNTIGVALQPGDKLGQAIVSLIPGTRNKASFAELPALIVGQIAALPRAVSRGMKFLRFGDTENILRNITKKIRKQRLKKGPATAKQRTKVRKLMEEARFELRERDVTRMSEVRAGRGQSFSTRRQFGSEFERKHPVFTSVFDTTGAITNTGSRILVGTDKFFGEIAKGGVTAAAKVQKAMRTDPKNWRKVIKQTRFTRKEKEDLVESAMEYVFRDKLSKTMTKASEFIGGIRPLGVPVGKALVPFFKTTVKLGRFVWNRSVLKLIEEAARMVGTRTKAGNVEFVFRGLDAKEVGKAINGMAVTTALAAYVWKNNGRFVGVAKTKEERNIVRMRDLEEIRIEWLDKDGNIKGTLPMNNLLPATPFVSALAAITQKNKRILNNEPAEDVYASETNAFVKSMLQQSVYNNLNEINRATGSLLDEKVAVNADGSADQASMRSGLQRYFKRLLAGRAIPAQLREIKRTGKMFGIDIAEEDRSIFETSGESLNVFGIPTGLPTPKAVGEEIRSGLPKFKGPIGKLQETYPFLSDKGLVRRVDFTGEIAKRSRRVTMTEIMGGGRKPKKDAILEELQRLKIFPGDAPQTKAVPIPVGSKASIKTRLTAEQQRQFNIDAGPKIMTALGRFMESEKYRDTPDELKEQYVRKIINFIRNIQGTVEGIKAFKRQLLSPEGRKQLDFDTFKGFNNYFFQPKK